MAQFRASIETGSGPAITRNGNKQKSIMVRLDGWNDGIRVEAHFDKDTGEDVFTVYRTAGSNGRATPDQIIDTYRSKA